MKLITFHSPKAFQELKEKGILKVPAKTLDLIDLKKYGIPYGFMVQKMKQKIPPESDEKYPIWAWEKCGGFIAPRKRKNILRVQTKPKVKITFSKPDKEVFRSDYMAYSFILSGHIVPRTQKEYVLFLKEMKNLGVTLDELKGAVRKEKMRPKMKQLFPEIQATWSRIFNMKSDVHQACIWNIKWDEVEKVELCDNPRYLYNSMNPLRADGTRPDWKKRYLEFIR